MLRKIPLSCWQNNPLTVFKRREFCSKPGQVFVCMCQLFWKYSTLRLFNPREPHTDPSLCTHTRSHTHTHTYTRSSVAARSLQVLINHPAVIPSWQLKLTSSWMGENKRPSSGPFPDTFIQSRPDCLRQHQQLFRLHLSPFDKACQVIFL